MIFNSNREWKFITTEVHSKKYRKDFLKREVLFILQVLLTKTEKENYFVLKNVYNSL